MIIKKKSDKPLSIKDKLENDRKNRPNVVESMYKDKIEQNKTETKKK